MPTKPSGAKGKKTQAKKTASKKKSAAEKKTVPVKKSVLSQADQSSRMKELGRHINNILPKFGFAGHKTAFLALEHTNAGEARLTGCHCKPDEICILDPETGEPIGCKPRSSFTGVS